MNGVEIVLQIPSEYMGALSLAIIAFIVLIVLGFLRASYSVVPPAEAHVVVTRGKGRRLYCSREGYKSSYWAVPILQKRSILPLRNKQLFIDDIPLRDRDLAKFVCDVVCWINIENPIQAAERIGEQERIRDFRGIEDDIKNLVKSVTRNSSMKMDLVTLMSERLTFSKEIADEIRPAIKQWGIALVDLECIHFRDQEPYTVISDLEKRQSKVIETTTRKKVAEKEKEASIVESDSTRETELKVAENEEKFKTRQLERDETLGMREQEKNMKIEETRQKANKQEVEALRTLQVGKAQVDREATITRAEGTAGEKRKIGEADADVTRLTGKARADVIEAQMTAEATGIDRKADAQKKYQESGAFAIEVISKAFDSYVEIQKSMFENFGPALQQANIRVISTGEEGTFLGLPVSAKGGIAAGGMLEGMKEVTGFDLGEIVNTAVETGKRIMKGPEKKSEKVEKK